MTSFHLFERFGVEIEYMLVKRDSLGVLPMSDLVLRRASGTSESEITVGEIGWSNELVLHVLEFKTKEPAPALAPLADRFQSAVTHANELLHTEQGMLLPTAMHPFMQPERDTVLWPHDGAEIYRTFDQIFDCRGHGWSNLQSVHINLPFAGDAEFSRLHAAIRLVLPLLPMLAASSPIVEGHLTGTHDNRLAYYRQNAQKLPVVTAQVIPEAVFSEADYRSQILEPIRAACLPFDTKSVLDPEWVNARGAIARFSRGSIEIRVLDVQECPKVDLAIVEATVALVRELVEERHAPLHSQQAFRTEELLTLYQGGVDSASMSIIDHPSYLSALGLSGSRLRAREAWSRIFERLETSGLLSSANVQALAPFQSHGSLAERIVKSLGASNAQEAMMESYHRLAGCLHTSSPFLPEP